MTFDELRIEPRIQSLLRTKGITVPTPIQAKAIPIASEGHDLIGIAQTGTGKTLAFGLPSLSRLATLPKGRTAMLILAPTRELAQQVNDVLAPVAKALGLTTACVYGGVGFEPQERALKRGTSIIVACPGRLLDHIGRGNARLDAVSILVLDEADRMLDMGFLPDIKRIIARLPQDRQTMMFSATFPGEIARLSQNLMRDPKRVEAGAVARPADAVRQGVYAVANTQKADLLKRILQMDETTCTLVFMKSKHATDRLAKALTRDGFSAEAIHGGHSQNRRSRAIEGFKSGRHRVLVATDVAARGLDVKGISHVVNYDIPATSDDYIHRIGRTARAEATGDAITFVTPDDCDQLRDIERAIGRPIERIDWDGAIPIDRAPRGARKPNERRPSYGRSNTPPAPRGRMVVVKSW